MIELLSTTVIQNQPFVKCECGTAPFVNLKSSSLVDPDEPGRTPSGDIHPPPCNSRHVYNIPFKFNPFLLQLYKELYTILQKY